MPKGIYKKTEEHKRKLGRLHLGKKLSKEHKRKISESEKGRIIPEETKLKISKTLMGHIVSKETCDKIRINTKAIMNKPEMKEKISNAIKKYFNEHPEVRKRLSEIQKGKKHSEETKRKLKIARSKRVLPKKDTKIEVKIQEFLKFLGIEFFTHQYMHIEHGYQCDIFIPSLNMVIECDGDYWHKYPTGNIIDNIRTKELLQRGFKVLRLWENEINKMDINNFRRRVGT